MFQERQSCHGFEREATKYSSPVGFSLTVIVEAHSCEEWFQPKVDFYVAQNVLASVGSVTHLAHPHWLKGPISQKKEKIL